MNLAGGALSLHIAARSLLSVVGSAVLAGFLSHVLVFIHGEWDIYAHLLALGWAMLHPALFLYFSQVEELPPKASLKLVGLESASYAIGLFGSIIIYRAFFHRLRKFPGPFFAALTGFWALKECGLEFKWFRKVEQLHKTYGDFVRVRSRELSINNVDAIQVIHGPHSKCIKGPWYDQGYPDHSMHSTRDKTFHNQRRRVWDRGFTSKSLRDYECRVLSHSLELLAQLSATAGKAVDASAWFNYFSFDVMGDLAFGKSFDMVKNGTPHIVLKRMHGTMALATLFGNIPWFTHIFLCLPIVRGETMKWLKWCEEQVKERKKMTRDRPDIFSHLVDDDVRKAKDPIIDLAMLAQDSKLVVVAGSDTAAATLSNTFYRLSKHPDKLQLLRKEIDPLFTSEADFNYKLVSDLPILDGVINEVLRVHSPSPSGVQRMTPKEGVTIAGTFIPGDTVVSIPSYTLQRGTYFAKPDEFLPERWSSMPELIHRKDAFAPFLIGAYSCVGKQLALMELRIVIALIVRKFDFAFASEETEHVFTEDPGPRDNFTLAVAPLSLVFTERGLSAS